MTTFLVRPLAILLMLSLAACATPTPTQLADNDPWENTNRDIFSANVWVQDQIAHPMVDTYRAIVPEPARDGLHNMVSNLRTPVILANDMLQARPKRAAQTVARLLINTTLGLGGLFDVARKMGIAYHDNDFGITLGVAGAHEGSYLVLPLLGPQPPRDLVGSTVDRIFDPFTWWRFPGRNEMLAARSGVSMLDTMNRNLDRFDSIERSSIDFYASTRSLYRQSRNAQINGEQALFQNLPDL